MSKHKKNKLHAWIRYPNESEKDNEVSVCEWRTYDLRERRDVEKFLRYLVNVVSDMRSQMTEEEYARYIKAKTYFNSWH